MLYDLDTDCGTPMDGSVDVFCTYNDLKHNNDANGDNCEESMLPVSGEPFCESLVKYRNGSKAKEDQSELDDTLNCVTKRRHECAVYLKNVSYTYGKTDALINVSSRISRGEIYGLLGPSGCGKTTLLRCVVGVTKPKKGQVIVFGKQPGTRNSTIPGPGVGYMPQDIALYNEFSIAETIDYFGQIYGLPKQVRKKRLDFLVKFLDLPNENRRIDSLSGGQKRRTSLAAALIHNPPLLILDEPTVGVDPLLRESIWQHLVQLSQIEQMTIILTTHYIEEARLAYKVGLMRMGQLLIEDKPNSLMDKYNVNTLEAVFLKVCELATVSTETFEQKSSPVAPTDKDMATLPESPRKLSKFVQDSNKIRALLRKGYLRLRRNVIEFVFQTILPALQIILFCLCIGQDPLNLNVAVYNPDQNYSLRFMNEIDSKYFNFINYSTLDEALNSVKSGNSWGAIEFDANYTHSVNQRFVMYSEISRETLAKSKIKLYADMSEFPIQITILSQLMNATDKYVRKLVNDVPIQFGEASSISGHLAKAFFERNKDELVVNKSAIAEPFIEVIEPPIYGDSKPSFRDFAAPGLILGVTYILAVGLTALAFVIDRKGGQLERTIIAGVHPFHILVAHILIQIAIILVQTAFLLFSVFVVFEIALKGSIFWVIVLTLVQGVVGMSFGFLISAFCQDEQTAIILTVASFYPNLILSGIFWPLEGMPPSLRYFSYFMPQTLPIKALRSIISRGWSLGYFDVWLGFLSSFVWVAVFNVGAVLVFVFHK